MGYFSHWLSYFSLKPSPTRKNRSVFLAGQLTGHPFAVWHRSITKATNTRITRRARTNLATQAERARWCHRWRQHSVAITDPHGAHGTWILFPHEIPWDPMKSRSNSMDPDFRKVAISYMMPEMQAVGLGLPKIVHVLKMLGQNHTKPTRASSLPSFIPTSWGPVMFVALYTHELYVPSQ